MLKNELLKETKGSIEKRDLIEIKIQNIKNDLTITLEKTLINILSFLINILYKI